MTTFEVTFESAEGRALKLLVAADNWVEAWQDGLFALGLDAVPDDATCEVTADGVRGQLPTQGRSFRVRVVRDPASPPGRGAPRLATEADPSDGASPRGRRPDVSTTPIDLGTPRAAASIEPPEPPTPVTRAFPKPPEPRTSVTRAAPVEPPEPPTAPSRSLAAFAPPHPKRAVPEPTEPTQPVAVARPQPGQRPAATRSRPTQPRASAEPTSRPATPDPIARVLSDLERQRILARPMRISPVTGLPTPVPAGRGARRTPTPQQVPRPGPSTDDKLRPRHATTAFSVDSDASLPQEFRPVLSAVPPADLGAALQWAADTAWEHVPCGLAMLVGVDFSLVETLDTHEPRDEVIVHGEVLAARGELARELKGCLVPVSTGPAALTARRPSRIRFSEDARLSVESLDERTFHLPITSVLRVPLDRMDAERLGFGILGLVLVNATRSAGFTDGEASAVAYLARTLANLASP